MFEAYPPAPTLAQDEIRLIRLLPGAWTDSIKCELVYDTLLNVRPYEALSYVWGSSKRTKAILLDGHPFAVTFNLESTLRHLRSNTQATLLWIDALCINQADDSERTHQVNLMGNIYRSSKGVLVYLGDGVSRSRHHRKTKFNGVAPQKNIFFDDIRDNHHIQRTMQTKAFQRPSTSTNRASDRRMQTTVDVFSFIRTLACVPHLVDIPWLASRDDDPEVETSLLYIIESLRHLMHAPFTPWWGRIWVVQEVILPPQVTVVCGTVSAPWAMFARAASHTLRHLHHCCSKGLDHLPRDFLKVLEDFGERVTDIDNLRSSSCLDEATQMKRPSSESVTSDHQTLPADHRSLASLLRRFRGRKASDPRDKVYALLSLVQSNAHRPPLMPDYSLSSVEVYTLAALESMYSSASLSVLTVDIARKYRQDLPTWVPDWEAPGDFSYNTRIDAMEAYDACIMYPINPDTVKVNGKALLIEGLNVDVIKYVGSAMISDGSETFLETLNQWLSMKQTHSNTKKSNRALWRALCADVLFLHSETADSAGLSRRLEDEDELMFVTWALTSKRSPFSNRQFLLPAFVSVTARLWIQIIDFERTILAARKGSIFQIFCLLFLDRPMREMIIAFAREMTRVDQAPRMTAEGFRELLAGYEAPVEAKDLDQDERETEAEMYGEIPWMDVLELVKPLLLKKLGSARKISQIPYEIQASLIDRSIVAATKGRRFFITQRGYIGLGPVDLKLDDALYLLKGGRTPSVLRRELENYWCDNAAWCFSATCANSKSSKCFRHWYRCACSNCLEQRCLHCFEQEERCYECINRYYSTTYKMIGDCYAHEFMDSKSVSEYTSKPDSRGWVRMEIF